MRYLYPDTSVWNCLCDQHADPHALSLALANRKVRFAIGFNVFYEIAELFFTGADKDRKRGRELLAYMKLYLTLPVPVPIIKENWALLAEEALDVAQDKRMETCFRDSGQYELAIQEIDKLFKGDVAPEVVQFFEGRKSLGRRAEPT